MTADILLALCIGGAIAGALALYLYLQREEINELFRDKLRTLKHDHATGNIPTNGHITDTNSLEYQLNSMLSDMAKGVEHSQKVSKITGKGLASTAKVGKSVLNTVYSPYNNISVVKLFLIIVVAVTASISVSSILANPAMGLATVIMSIIVPFAMVNILGLKNKSNINKGNLHLLSVLLPIYRDATSFEQSLRGVLGSLDTKSRQYKAVQKCYSNLLNLSMAKADAIEVLKKDLMADKYVVDYFNIVLQAEMNDKAYKDSLGSVLKSYEALVIENDSVVSNAFYSFILYIGGIIGLIAMTAMLKSNDPKSYMELTTTVKGQAVILGIFTVITVAGLAMAKAADLIKLNIAIKEEDDPLKEDIYV